jgi:hypothetical protein
MKRPTKLPSIDLLEYSFEYDPVTGDLFTKSGKAVRNNDRIGTRKIRVGRKSTTVARVCWALFYKKDPIGKMITHINGDPFDNRITNLRAVKL